MLLLLLSCPPAVASLAIDRIVFSLCLSTASLMFLNWRLQLREARLAVAEGRWEEAASQLTNEKLREFLPAKRLSHELAGRLVSRAQKHLDQGQSSAGWRDLAQAGQLGADERELSRVRSVQRQRRLTRVLQWLASGDLQLATAEMERLSKRGLTSGRTKLWTEVLSRALDASRFAKRGNYLAAAEMLATALRVAESPANSDELGSQVPAAAQFKESAPQERAVCNYLEQTMTECQHKSEHLQQLGRSLHERVAAANWTEVLATADELLELVPAHREARRARRRAWDAVGMEQTQAYTTSKRSAGHRQTSRSANFASKSQDSSIPTSTHVQITSDQQSPTDTRIMSSLDDNPADSPTGGRTVAWIDYVGGYLLCLDDEIVVGRPGPGVDVPILADLSQRHIAIRREGESYLLQPYNRVSVNGSPVVGPTVLHPGDRIQLNDVVELEFRRPHALSATAVLKIASHHKTEPAVDGIVLMADSCILGPQRHSHIVCRNWDTDLVLFCRGDDLLCRSGVPLLVDGSEQDQAATISANSRIEGEDFAMSFESL